MLGRKVPTPAPGIKTENGVNRPRNRADEAITSGALPGAGVFSRSVPPCGLRVGPCEPAFRSGAWRGVPVAPGKVVALDGHCFRGVDRTFDPARPTR